MKDNYPHPSWIEIDLKTFRKNIEIIRQYIGNCLFCLPIKANAYGHGLCQIGKVAEEAGVDYLAVSCLKVGAELKRAGIKIPILVLGAIHEDQITDLVELGIEFTISSKFKANLVAKSCQLSQMKCRVHLEVDTGMQRTGVRSESAVALFEHVKSIDCFEVAGIYSHLATADRFEDLVTLKQIAAFKELSKNPIFAGHSLTWHLANSGGVAYFEKAYLHMVRPGIMVFGILSGNEPAALKGLSPCFSLKARVSYFKVVEAGKGVSYGHTFITQKRSRIVTIPIGYVDGYRRALSNKGSVLIRGKRFPIVGTICMDQFMVDTGEEEIYVGDEVVLIGEQEGQKIAVQEIAHLCDTIPYEILCQFNERTPRIYNP
jgi:alanine racemase